MNNNQYNNRNYSRSDDYDYAPRRARHDAYSDYNMGNFDVSEDSYQRPRQPQQRSYDSRDRQYQQRQSYDNRSRQQGYGQGYDNRGRQQVQQRQGYDNRGRQQYPSDYDNAYRDDYYRSGRQQQRPQNYDSRYDRNRGYDDGYNGNRRPRSSGGYDNRNVSRNSNTRSRRPKKRTSPAIIVVRVIAIIMLIVGGVIIGVKLYHSYSDKKGHADLAQLSADYEALYAKNNDFFGWMKIDDTLVDYPVMYVPGDNDTYLHTDFDGNYSESGELFMDGSCNPDGNLYLIYGHHMYNGSMFGNLPKYADYEYYSEHQTIHFNTRFETADYEVFAVFYSQIFDADDYTDFQYYEYQNLDDQGTYDYYVQQVKNLSEFDTGITPQFGQRIITLSTCNYHTEDGRFVVCAVKK